MCKTQILVYVACGPCTSTGSRICKPCNVLSIIHVSMYVHSVWYEATIWQSEKKPYRTLISTLFHTIWCIKKSGLIWLSSALWGSTAWTYIVTTWNYNGTCETDCISQEHHLKKICFWQVQWRIAVEHTIQSSQLKAARHSNNEWILSKFY